MDTPELFDRRRRRQRRDRAAARFTDHDFLIRRMGDELLDRLALISGHSFARALVIGAADTELVARLRAMGTAVVAADAGFAFARAAGGVQCDEDRLPFADASVDLVLSVGVLDSVNDLPGALALIRRILRPDGLFLGAFAGAGSLTRLRLAMFEGDGDHVAARIHPQIDVGGAGDLLMRAGFALPVADGERLTVRYGSLIRLAADLRGMAATSVLADAAPPLGRPQLARALASFAEQADPDGRTPEVFDLVYLTGWAPDPSQPKPARRGSATVSLAEALKPKS